MITYPRRFLTRTLWLSESEISLAYRRRFAGYRDRFDELHQIDDELRGLMRGHAEFNEVWVVVSLVPDVGGEFSIDGTSYDAFTAEVAGPAPLIGGGDRGYWRHYGLKNDKFTAHGGSERRRPRGPACILRRSGAGSFAFPIEGREAEEDASVRIYDEDVVNIVLGGL